MNDIERYQRDRASVMSMLKFILMVVIIAACCYVGKIIAVILIPFLIGFVLAKTSDMMARPIAKHLDKDAKRIKNGHKKSTHTLTAIVMYVILNILLCIIIVITCVGLVYQANNLLVTLAEATTTFKPGEMLDSQFLARFTVENGGFLTPDMVESLTLCLLMRINGNIACTWI